MNPYPGLRPFRPDEARLFCGREIALEFFTTRTRISPLTIMFARSGVGKSSFLTCRLIPELSTASKVCYINEWGNSVPDSLIAEGLQSLSSGDEFSELPILILDQFEDVFKLAYKREDMWDRLAGVVNASEPPVHVLIAMREEWLGACGEAAEYIPDALRSMMRLGALTRKELIRAIQRPSQIEGQAN